MMKIEVVIKGKDIWVDRDEHREWNKETEGHSFIDLARMHGGP